MYNIHSQVSSSSPKVIYYNTDVTNPVHTLLCEVYTNIIYIRELFAVFSSPIKVASIIKGEFELRPRKHIVTVLLARYLRGQDFACKHFVFV